ncbi:MAG: DegT/DnrJ/EryC1/StrS family aminotransferase, partial [Solirubrobacteraceae bacterium]
CIFHLFPARFDNRDDVAAVLREQGIESAVHYAPTIHGHEAWKEHPLFHGDLPVSEDWAARELSLPMHPDLTPAEIERVVEAVHAALA